jgi:hypothetical protein
VATLNFHVRHEVNPERAWGVLDALMNEVEYDHITQYDRSLSRLRQLGLVANKGEPVPSEDGRELHRIGLKRPDVAWDIMHFLHYIRWNPSTPTTDTMFYTYQEYCSLLHSRRNVNLGANREAFAVELNSQITASEYFREEISNLAKGAVSLSANSLLGVEHWLSKLSPEVLPEKGNFALRHYCSPELLLMAFRYVTEITEAQLGLEQPLSQDRRDVLCRICLIEDSSLDQILDWLFPEYPEFIQPGTTTGSYGRFVRVLEKPTLKDLLR